MENAEASPGAVRVAREWVEALRDDNSARVWALLDDDCRLAWAQAWLSDNPLVLLTLTKKSKDEAAEDLATLGPGGTLWRFAREYLRRTFQGLTHGLENRDFGHAQHARLVAPGIELVRLFDLADLRQDGQGVFRLPDGQGARALSLMMSLGPSGGWRVAGIGNGVLCPGWPPVYQPLATPGD